MRSRLRPQIHPPYRLRIMPSVETPLLWSAVTGYAASVGIGLARRTPGRILLAAGILPLVVAYLWRGWTIRYLPLTQRAESIGGFVLCVGIVAFFADRWVAPRPTRADRVYRTALLLPATALLAHVAMAWPAPRYPFSLLVTVWYALHVPVSFVCYALWSVAFAAAAARLAAARTAEEAALWDARVHTMVLWGFLLFTLSMIFGGIWGYLAWGFVFLWDPKMFLSVSLWFVYAALVHLGFSPPRPRLRAVLTIPAWLILWLAFLGIGFFRSSIHGFG